MIRNFREIKTATYALDIDGALNDIMKKTIRAKITSYVKRAEELKALPNTSPAPVPVNPAGPKEDPETAQMMEKFQG